MLVNAQRSIKWLIAGSRWRGDGMSSVYSQTKKSYWCRILGWLSLYIRYTSQHNTSHLLINSVQHQTIGIKTINVYIHKIYVFFYIFCILILILIEWWLMLANDDSSWFFVVVSGDIINLLHIHIKVSVDYCALLYCAVLWSWTWAWLCAWCQIIMNMEYVY